MNAWPLPSDWLTKPIRITVAGAGGTGSQVLDQLASLDSLMRTLGHPGFRVRVFDPDTVSRWNLGRQRFAAPDIGLAKAVVLAHRLNMFYGVEYEAHTRKLDMSEAGHADLLITCTDSAKFRADVGGHYAKRDSDTVWLDFGNGDGTAQAILGHLGRPKNGQRVPNVFDLFPQLATMQAEDEKPSCSMEEAVRKQPWPVNRIVAIAGMTMLERWLRTGTLSFHGSLLQLDPYTVTPITIDPVMWSMYGYEVKSPVRKRKAKAEA